jgi:tetratricopeptide (TPR) repeat protein
MLSCLRLAFFLVFALVFQASPITPEQRKEAGLAFQRGEWAKAGTIYARIADQEPSNAAAWHRLGYCRYQAKEYEPALAAFAQASEVGQSADSMYSAGCMCALLKRPDPAFEWIDKALEAGFSDEATFLADEDLASVRADPRYAAAKVKVHANARPCSVDPKARQFDFWIGEWDVKSTANGTLVGKSSIQLILGDCVIFENWANLKGGTGKSLNVYNRDKGFWQQTWIDDHGEVTEYVNGALKDGAMQFVAGPETTSAGERLRRMTFYDQGPKQVRQLIETSTDGGKTWAAQYDLTYVRKQDVATK